MLKRAIPFNLQHRRDFMLSLAALLRGWGGGRHDFLIEKRKTKCAKEK